MDMGFEAERVDWALHATKNRGLQPALDHVVENSERPIPDYKSQPAANSSSKAGTEEYDAEDQAALADMYAKNGQKGEDDMLAGIGEAQSIKCVECGKLLKSAAFASFHAEKSGHTNFEESTEEIKPLTEEEKKQKLQDSE
jgi:phage FluMu protein Com